MSFEFIKAGWLHRQSSVLKRWKKSWFVLYMDGDLKYFESPENPVAEEVFHVGTKLIELRTGANQATDITPPPEVDRNCIITVVLSDNISVVICAESEDDMRAWQTALHEARSTRMSSPPTLTYGSNVTYVVHRPAPVVVVPVVAPIRRFHHPHPHPHMHHHHHHHHHRGGRR